jgi:hypothetical protein
MVATASTRSHTIPAVSPSPDEEALRQRAIALVGRYWNELEPRIARWLHEAFQEDDSLPGQVAYTMLRRFGNGDGYLLIYLRRNPDGAAEHEKQVLFFNAKKISEDLRVAAWRRRPERADLSAFNDADNTFAAPAADQPPAPVGEDPGGPSRGAAPVTDRQQTLLDALRVLLTRGEQAWNNLCEDGVLNSSEWTDEQKWTAIAMLWGFEPRHVDAIRRAKTGKPPGQLSATKTMMTSVRNKGRQLLDAMSREFRLEHDLPLPLDADDPAGGPP